MCHIAITKHIADTRKWKFSIQLIKLHCDQENDATKHGNMLSVFSRNKKKPYRIRFHDHDKDCTDRSERTLNMNAAVAHVDIELYESNSVCEM